MDDREGLATVPATASGTRNVSPHERTRAGLSREGPAWERILLSCLYLTAVPAVLMGLYAESVPGTLFPLWIFTLCVCLLLVAPAWLVLFAGALAANWRMGRTGLARWFGVPLIGLAYALCTAYYVPVSARFELSRGAFDQALAEHRNSPGAVGLYTVDSILNDGDTAYFVILEGGLMDECGFVHTGKPGTTMGHLVQGLGGGWWLWCS